MSRRCDSSCRMRLAILPGPKPTITWPLKPECETTMPRKRCNRELPEADFIADRHAGYVDWLMAMTPSFKEYAESSGEREADLAIDLADAEADVNNAIANANTAFYTALAANELAMQGLLTPIQGQLEVLSDYSGSIYKTAMAAEQSLLDEKYAEAAKDYLVAAAAAEKVYMVAMLNDVATAEDDRLLALANAELVQATAEAAADLAWSTAEAGEFGTLRVDVANGAFGLVVPSLNAVKGADLADAAAEAIWLTSVTTADNNYATAQVHGLQQPYRVERHWRRGIPGGSIFRASHDVRHDSDPTHAALHRLPSRKNLRALHALCRAGSHRHGRLASHRHDSLLGPNEHQRSLRYVCRRREHGQRRLDSRDNDGRRNRGYRHGIGGEVIRCGDGCSLGDLPDPAGPSGA